MKSASVRLIIAALSLLTALLTLAVTLVRLVTAAAAWGVGRLARPAQAVPAVSGRPNLRVVSDDGKREQLTRGLVGMGFRAPDVRGAVAGLSDEEIARTAMPELFKRCIGKLASHAGRAA